MSQADFLVGAVPADAGNLVISQMDYNPADARPGEVSAGFTNRDSFEYLELMNIGAETISLDGVGFVAGIDFSFPEGILLASGARFVIARNAVAYAERFGIAPDGVFANGSGLSNGGEQLRLLAANGGVIRDFEYHDDGEWPAAADGQGFRLVVVNPVSNPDHALPASWRASYDVRGSEDDDWDGDGVGDLVELALGTDASDSSERAGITGFINGDRLAVMFQRPTNAPVLITVERSTDLVTWESGAGFVELFSSTPNPDGTTMAVFQSAFSRGQNPEYLRLRVEAPQL